MPKEYFVTNSRFKIILIVLFIMWCGIMTLFYLKADEVTKNPCSVCANKIGESIYCYTSSGMFFQSKTFYPNYTIEVGGENVRTNILP